MVPSAPLIGIIVTSSSHCSSTGRPEGYSICVCGGLRGSNTSETISSQGAPPLPHPGGPDLPISFAGTWWTRSSDGVRMPLSSSLRASSSRAESRAAKRSKVRFLVSESRRGRGGHGLTEWSIRVRSTRRRDFKAVGRIGWVGVGRVAEQSINQWVRTQRVGKLGYRITWTREQAGNGK